MIGLYKDIRYSDKISIFKPTKFMIESINTCDK